MNPVALFLDILQSAVRILSGAGVSDKVTQQIAGVIQFAGDLVKRGSEGANDLAALDDHLKIMVEEGRGPTDEEWDALDAELRAVDERFARIKESLG